jgi:hypothetical protein
MKKAVVAVAALAILGMAAMMAKHGPSVVYAHDGKVVGTWIVTVTVNTPPGAPRIWTSVRFPRRTCHAICYPFKCLA